MADPNCKKCGGTGHVPAGYSTVPLPNEICPDCDELEPIEIDPSQPFTPTENEAEEQFWSQYEEDWDNGGS